jgi:hypothetical protein
VLFKARCREGRLSGKMHGSKLEKELPAKHAKKRRIGSIARGGGVKMYANRLGLGAFEEVKRDALLTPAGA